MATQPPICDIPAETGTSHDNKETKKAEKKKKLKEEEPYSNPWIGHQGRSSESYQTPPHENKEYGGYSTGGGAGAGEGEDGLLGVDSMEPSKLPKGMNAAQAKKLVSNSIKAMKKKDYVIYTEKYKVNLVGIRTPINSNINYFNDWFVVFWWESDSIEDVKYKVYKQTTVPGLACRKGGTSSSNSKGAGWLIESQFTFTIGKAKQGTDRAYTCLRPDNKQISYRSKYNSAGKLIPSKKNGKIWLDGKMNHGMLIHKSSYKSRNAAYSKDTTKRIGSWSYGCQVFARTDHYEEMLGYCFKAKKKTGQKKFKYAILLESDL